MKSPEQRILLFDIETSPNVGYTWGKYEQNVVQFKEGWNLLSFAYKWLGEKQVYVVSMRQSRSLKNDFFVVKRLHALFNEADVVVAHNGKSFDVKMAQSKFMMHGLPPPSPFVTIDTKTIAKRYGRFMSNSLDDLGEDLKLGRKMKHDGFETWLGCMAGDNKAWDTLERYNKQDVVLLERLYLCLRGYMSNHPRIHWSTSCEVCGGKVHGRGVERSKTRFYRRVACQECGSWRRVTITQKEYEDTRR